MNKDKPVYLRRFSASWVYCSVVSMAAMNLGKAYPNESCLWLKFLLKQELYCVRKRGRWYEQLALIKQSHLKRVLDVNFNISFAFTMLRIVFVGCRGDYFWLGRLFSFGGEPARAVL